MLISRIGFVGSDRCHSFAGSTTDVADALQVARARILAYSSGVDRLARPNLRLTAALIPMRTVWPFGSATNDYFVASFSPLNVATREGPPTRRDANPSLESG
jgi:hypothetical protein